MSSRAPNNQQSSSVGQNNFVQLFNLFRKHFLLVLIPVSIFSAAAAAYVLTRQPVWRATQSIQIRDELAIQTVIPGRFNSLDMMKMVQETIHETVRRHSVVKKILMQVEPPSDYENPELWPQLEDIEGMQYSISLGPPNGAEFGRTEILLLSVKDESTERAKRIVGLLAKELQFQLNDLRDKRAASIEHELEESVRLAKIDLKESNQELADFEKGLGDILVDLRSISSELGSGSTTLNSRLNVILIESRAVKQKYDVLAKQLENIRQAELDPKHVLTFSSELLDAQPVLKKLKEELVSLQSNTAKTLGQFEPYHSKAKAALEAEKIVEKKILAEVKVAQQGLAARVGVVENQIRRLEESEKDLLRQLKKLAELRAPYATLLKMVQQRRSVLDKALEELAHARSSRAAVKTTNLITLLDEPYSGSRPEGMSKKIFVGAAGFAGLLSGIGLVFFAASPSFIGPMTSPQNEPGHEVTMPAWKAEALSSAPRVVTEPETEPPKEQVRPSKKRTRPQSRPAAKKQQTDIRKVDFTKHEDEVDFEEMFGEPEVEFKIEKSGDSISQVASQETFNLEPRQDSTSANNDSESKDRTDAQISDTIESEPGDGNENEPSNETKETRSELEISLQEKHRKRIEELFRDDD